MFRTDDTGAVRATFDRVLARPEFDYEESLLDRLGDWMSRTLERFMELLRIPGAGAPGGTGIGSYIVLFILIAIVVALIVFMVHRLRRSTRRRRRDTGDSPVSVTVRSDDGRPSWMDDYLAESAQDRTKMEILDAYRRMVRGLVDRGVLGGSAGDSPRELLAELDDTTNASVDLMSQATDIFEGPWYARDTPDPDDPRRLEAIASRVLDERER